MIKLLKKKEDAIMVDVCRCVVKKGKEMGYASIAVVVRVSIVEAILCLKFEVFILIEDW